MSIPRLASFGYVAPTPDAFYPNSEAEDKFDYASGLEKFRLAIRAPASPRFKMTGFTSVSEGDPRKADAVNGAVNGK